MCATRLKCFGFIKRTLIDAQGKRPGKITNSVLCGIREEEEMGQNWKGTKTG